MSKKTTTIFSASAEQHPPCHDMQVTLPPKIGPFFELGIGL